MEQQEKNNKVQAMSRSQLASAYGVDVRTFKKWLDPFLEELNLKADCRIFYPNQIKKIFEVLGEP